MHTYHLTHTEISSHTKLLEIQLGVDNNINIVPLGYIKHSTYGFCVIPLAKTTH